MTEETETNVDRQLRLEEEALSMGIDRYRQQQLPWQAHKKPLPESERMVGRRLVHHNLPKVAQRVEDFIHTTLYRGGKGTGRGGARTNASMARLVEQLRSEEVAFAALKVAVDSFGKSQALSQAAIRTAKLIETQVHVAQINAYNRNYAAKVQAHAQSSNNEKHSQGVISGAAHRLGIEPERLDTQQRMRLGMMLMDWIYEETGMIETKDVKDKGKTTKYLVPTEQAMRWMEDSHAQAEQLFPLRLPMVCKPRKWQGPYGGGYLSEANKLKLVKVNKPNYLQELDTLDLSGVYQAVNAVQETPWSINGEILRVVKCLWERSSTVGKLPSREPIPLPAKPEDIDTNEESRAWWRRTAANIHAANTSLIGKRAATAQKIWIADKFRTEEAIYFPHQLDWRGRLYPAASLINPQGDDLSKGLIQFAYGKPLGEEGAWWLAVHVANTWGNDKVSLQERVDWTHANSEWIVDQAQEPIDGTMEWAEADKPFQFLAAAMEWEGYQEYGTAYVSRQPVAQDGSCSGLQHFSAMLRDPVGGKACNLRPSERPQDIYQAVADKTQERVQEDYDNGDEQAAVWMGNVSRKVAKRPTMTLPYGVTQYGMRDQIDGYLQECDTAGKPAIDPEANRWNASRYITNHIYNAINDTVVAARDAMDWLQAVAKVAAKDDIPVRWTTPMGFPVHQDYRKSHKIQVNTHFGGARLQPAIHCDKDQLDPRRQASGIAPNYVHSLDACHLMATVQRANDEGIEAFAMIHDSFGTHAADTGKLNRAIRETFVEQYTPDRLQEFKDEVADQLSDEAAAQLPDVPEKGSLDLNEVLESVYFFA